MDENQLKLLQEKAEAYGEVNGHEFGEDWRILEPVKNALILPPSLDLDSIPDIWFRACKYCGAAVTVTGIIKYEELESSLAEMYQLTINYNFEFQKICPMGKTQLTN